MTDRPVWDAEVWAKAQREKPDAKTVLTPETLRRAFANDALPVAGFEVGLTGRAVAYAHAAGEVKP
jgi:hypothetical protein